MSMFLESKMGNVMFSEVVLWLDKHTVSHNIAAIQVLLISKLNTCLSVWLAKPISGSYFYKKLATIFVEVL